MYDGFTDRLADMVVVWSIPMVLVLLIGLSVVMIIINNKNRRPSINNRSLQKLNEQYAKGEIDDAEYSRRKKEIKGL
ncbi:MAG: SHOCT domain-containing protein [Alkalibacterium sp.]|nr:SHOCT domain-containing protein [Alkalibacterium sp.]